MSHEKDNVAAAQWAMRLDILTKITEFLRVNEGGFYINFFIVTAFCGIPGLMFNESARFEELSQLIEIADMFISTNGD